jgi:orotidine-5'-phosphate decarboxylase
MEIEALVPFGERLAHRVRERGPACVGLDPHLDRVPGLDRAAPLRVQAEAVRGFCLAVVEAVAPIVPAVKPQLAFFEALGSAGVAVLEEVVASARDAGLIVVADGKRGDIGTTAEAYAAALLDDDGPLRADAATVSPYLGPESLTPFASRTAAGKGVFVLVRTSNPGAGPWQVDTGVAERVAAWVAAASPGPGLGAVGAVVAATLPRAEVDTWRARMPHAWFLVPGVGAQGATPDSVRAHLRSDGLGALIASSREILFAPGERDLAAVRAGVAARARRLSEAARIW